MNEKEVISCWKCGKHKSKVHFRSVPLGHIDYKLCILCLEIVRKNRESIEHNRRVREEMYKYHFSRYSSPFSAFFFLSGYKLYKNNLIEFNTLISLHRNFKLSDLKVKLVGMDVVDYDLVLIGADETDMFRKGGVCELALDRTISNYDVGDRIVEWVNNFPNSVNTIVKKKKVSKFAKNKQDENDND